MAVQSVIITAAEQCRICDKPITEERKRGRGLPPVTCSPECSRENAKRASRANYRARVERLRYLEQREAEGALT